MKLKEMTFLPQNKTVTLKEGDSVLETALRHKIPLAHSCGGMGSCTTCRVFVEKSVEPVNNRTEVELEIIEGRDFAPNERLSCQLDATHGLVVRIP
jgi:2Fe-2S ferredoxin